MVAIQRACFARAAPVKQSKCTCILSQCSFTNIQLIFNYMLLFFFLGSESNRLRQYLHCDSCNNFVHRACCSKVKFFNWFSLFCSVNELFLTIHFFSKKVIFHPNWLGKLTTCSQMLLIAFCIFNWTGATFLAFSVAFLTIASGIVYTVRELRQFS